MTRRNFMVGASAALFLLPFGVAFPVAESRASTDFAAAIRRIEGEVGGRLGVAALDLKSRMRLAYRPDELFPLCSTFKLLVAAAVLARVDQGHEQLSRPVPIGAARLLPNSPITARHAGGHLTLAELCEAAITVSDNLAGNLLLEAVDGPAGLTRYLRSIGDPVSRLDRWEVELNESLPGDLRDTTSPAAMLADLQRLLVGEALSPSSRSQLTAWLKASRTGDTRLRVGLPAGWAFGDKTGTGERGSTNDVAIAWPPGRPPLLIAAYLTGTIAAADRRNAALAAVAKAVVEHLPA
ncbi:class A beta-lactamase [Labrys sp. (in: a-proteobacteria)]|uniref:class A beta-lactamase n=1 Tax=Labrys sp. (in: a-proteobacteria) TaxID=1917972 RepID=UPI0039E30B17